MHPGYGFLSERVEFAEKLATEGIKFIGPRPEHLRDFGLKHTAREIAEKAGVPMLPGTALLAARGGALRGAESIGLPGHAQEHRGRRRHRHASFAKVPPSGRNFATVARLAARQFRRRGLFLENIVARARHVEVQIFGDGHGGVVALGERDCSLQRRNQKVVEETPPPKLPEHVSVAASQDAAVRSRRGGAT